ncbi:uncharacterized protein LOC124885820 [Capsicum annuum]|uniref:uncharacterized protein LOC124885820 n=1 Tax=Capsicum annuum TaxID=4072 RepID=UPI001FB11467|nr:uncharacterized protein LOC124885820 [Capsicum annuum]
MGSVAHVENDKKELARDVYRFARLGFRLFGDAEAPFEALYGRSCRLPIGWFEVGEATVTGPDAMFEAMENVAYEFDLPAELSNVYPVFHVSMLKRCIGNSVVIEPSEDLDIQNNLSFEEFLVEILDFQVWKLRSKEVPLVKVFLRNQSVEGATWEVEAEMHTKYPHLFSMNPERVQGIILF